MEDSLYDEFGNYIGPELQSSDEDASETSSEHEEPDTKPVDEEINGNVSTNDVIRTGCCSNVFEY